MRSIIVEETMAVTLRCRFLLEKSFIFILREEQIVQGYFQIANTVKATCNLWRGNISNWCTTTASCSTPRDKQCHESALFRGCGICEFGGRYWSWSDWFISVASIIMITAKKRSTEIGSESILFSNLFRLNNFYFVSQLNLTRNDADKRVTVVDLLLIIG